jgi:ketosteroid isomerase-like protein
MRSRSKWPAMRSTQGAARCASGQTKGDTAGVSDDNVELVRLGMEAWDREDIQELIALSDSDVEFVSIFAGMEGRTYRGYNGLREYFADMRDTWSEFHRDIERVIDAGGDKVVVFFRLRGTARVSGVPLEERVTTVFQLREGRLYRMVVFRNRDEALKAAGLKVTQGDS